MPYATQFKPRSRTIALGTVAAIHLVAIYVLVTGLAGVLVTRMLPTRTTAFNIPSPSPTTPARHPAHAHPQALPKADPQPTAQPSTPFRPAQIERGVDFTMPPQSLPSSDPEPPLVTPSARTYMPRAALPIGAPGKWVTADDYPAVDLREEHVGVTRFSLSISGDGRVSSCIVTASSGWPMLDAATCQLLTRRARFTPATDENGARTTGNYTGNIHWEIPQ